MRSEWNGCGVEEGYAGWGEIAGSSGKVINEID